MMSNTGNSETRNTGSYELRIREEKVYVERKISPKLYGCRVWFSSVVWDCKSKM